MITVNYKEQCGEATFCHSENGTDYSYNLELYVGNAFLVLIHNDNGNRELAGFFVDADHMERCLKAGIFLNYDRLTAITINKAKCRNYKKIVALLAEYMDDVDIHIYKEGNYTWHEFPAPSQTIPDSRIREIAETAISYICDHDMLDDFHEDRGLEFDTEEKSYFGIYDDNDDGDEEEDEDGDGE